MSRTIRRRNGSTSSKKLKFELIFGNHSFLWVPRDLQSLQYKRDKAIYHSDTGTHDFKEPGPHWYRNLTTDRPARRNEKLELKKFINNPNYEPMILPKGKLKYWT